jgi:hypothetical protein
MLFLSAGVPLVFPGLPRNLVDFFLVHDDVENTKRYLEAGRFWRRLSDEQLTEGWLATWRAFFLQNKTTAADVHTGLSAELRLRGIDPPVHEITVVDRERAMAAAREAMETDKVNQRRVAKDFSRLQKQLAKPKN